MPFSRGSSRPRDQTQVSCIAGRFFTVWATRKAPEPSSAAAAAKSLQLCPTLCDPIDGSPPGSTIPGILQARTLEWVAISFSDAWNWKVKVKSVVSYSSRPHGLQSTRLLHPWDFPGKSTGVDCHCLLRRLALLNTKSMTSLCLCCSSTKSGWYLYLLHRGRGRLYEDNNEQSLAVSMQTARLPHQLLLITLAAIGQRPQLLILSCFCFSRPLPHWLQAWLVGH